MVSSPISKERAAQQKYLLITMLCVCHTSPYVALFRHIYSAARASRVVGSVLAI